MANDINNPAQCDGCGLDNGNGRVVPIILSGNGWQPTKFNYCQTCIEEDRQKGFTIVADKQSASQSQPAPTPAQSNILSGHENMAQGVLSTSASQAQSTPEQPKSYPGHQYQNLFNWLSDRDVTPFTSEMDEVIEIVHRDFPAQPIPDEQDDEPYFGWCNVEGCENEGCSGGNAWRETGYWTVCYKHSADYREGKPQPKMKQSAIDREASRGEDGRLPINSIRVGKK